MAFDTPFAPTDEQVAKQDQDLAQVAGEVTPSPLPAAPAAAPTPSPIGPTTFSIFNALKLGAAGVKAVTADPAAPQIDRTNKGFGTVTGYPTEQDVQKLRQNQGDKDLLDLFNTTYGAGSANRYLNYPAKADVDKLLKNKHDPDMVALFDRTYGDISKYIVPLYDPKTLPLDKIASSSALAHIFEGGKGFGDVMAESAVGEAVGSVAHGVGAAGMELARSVASITDHFAGSHLEDKIGSSEDTRLTDHPIVNGVITGLSQFIAGSAVLAPLTAGVGGAGAVATAIRGMSSMGLVSAFSFNPDDPLLGDLAKHLGMGDNWFTHLDSIDTYKSEFAKRGVRGAEGALMGAAFDLVGALWKGVKAAKAGDTAAADAAKNAAADIIDKNKGLVDPKQLDLPLGDNLPAQVEPTFSNAGKMDLPVEGRLDQLPGSIVGKAAETAGEMEARLHDKWGQPHQLTLDMGAPTEGPFLHSRDTGAQGELFGLPTRTKTDLEAPKAPQGELFPAKERPDLPKSYSDAEIAQTPREQFVKDAIEGNPPIVREVKAQVEGHPAPAVEVPQTVRAILDAIPDFTNHTVAAIKDAVSPLLDTFLNVAKRTPGELENILVTQLHPADVNKIQALTSRAVAQTERQVSELGAKLDALKKEKITDAGEITRLAQEVKSAHDLLSNLQKLDFPLGTYAGRLLQQRQIEQRITMAHKVDIESLRSRGVPEAQINALIRTAMDMSGSSALSKLMSERSMAAAKGDLIRVAQLDGFIKTELGAVEKAAKKNFTSLSNKIVGDIASYSISSILSGMGTVFRNLGGIQAHVVMQRLFQLSGMVDKYGVKDGITAYAMQFKARAIALRSGHSSFIQSLGSIIKDAAVDSFHGESKTHINSMSGERSINAAKYGLEGKPATALNALGTGAEMLTLPLRLTDEFSASIVARHAIGTRAAFNFYEALRSQRDLISAKLRDPNLTAAEKTQFTAELDKLKGKDGTIDIDGKPTTLREHVEARVKDAYDESGKLKDITAVDDTNYLLLRNRQTPSVFGQAIEKAMSSTPYIRFLVPVFNAPMNGFKRGMETVPILRHVLSDMNAELKSADPFIRATAVGKLNLGWGIMGSSLLLADAGVITYEAVNKRADRLSAQSSSSTGPFQLKIGGASFDITGLDPISIPLIWAAVYMNSVKEYNAALQQKVDAQNADPNAPHIGDMEKTLEQLKNIGFAIAGATGQSIMQNPAVSGLQDVAKLLTNLDKMQNDESAFGKEATQLARGQMSKLIPNMFRQMNGFMDNKRYDPVQVRDMLLATAGVTSTTPMLYDVMGRPMLNKSPLRSILGPLSPMEPPSTASKAQYVIDTLDNLGKVTGHYYTFTTAPPDSLLLKAGVDLRAVSSVVGNRTVQDQFAEQYRTVKVNGNTIDEALYQLLAHDVISKVAVGNKLVDGPVWSQVTATINSFKKVAWELTLRSELAGRASSYNKELQEKVNAAYSMKTAATNPAFDIPQQETEKRTKEILTLFPPI